MAYYLPRTTFTVTGTLTLNKCATVSDGAGGFIPSLDVKAALTPIEATEPDPANRYYISYAESQSWMKEINFAIGDTQNGILQSFNSTINDQAGPDIVAGIGAVVQIGSAFLVGGVGTPSILASKAVKDEVQEAGKPAPPDYCSAVSTGLKTISDEQAKIDFENAHPVPDPSGAAAQTARIQASQAIIDATRKKDKFIRAISFKWVPGGSDDLKERDAGEYRLYAIRLPVVSILDDWLSDQNLYFQRALKNHTESGQTFQTETAPFLLTLAVDRRTMGDPAATADTHASSDGLVLRDPAYGLFRMCRESDSTCTTDDAVMPDNQVVETTFDSASRMAVRMPQFGRTLVLPEHGGLFQNAALTVTLNADGSISTIGYHTTSSLASGIQGVGTAAGGVTTAIGARNSAIAAVNTAAAAATTAATNAIQAPDTYNKALADCLAQQAAILKAGGTPVSCQ